MNEARKLYDQLLPIAPILLALTAATPMANGFLTDTDTRWNTVAAAADDRTREESGDKALSNDRWRIPKSRFSSNSTYISQDPRLRDEYLNPALVVDEAIRDKLLGAGMDQRLATHFARLFIRDPLLVVDKYLERVNPEETMLFDTIQTTNWQTLRFKPPALFTNDLGWRVEFRSTEVQITDFENAAFSIFIVLLTRTILHFDLNFYVPIKKIDENMETAHARDAVVSRSFFFRRKITPDTVDSDVPSDVLFTNGEDTEGPPSRGENGPARPVADEYRLMTIDEIINGGWSSPGNEFPGLMPFVHKYLDTRGYDSTTRDRLDEYLNLVKERANGQMPTTARLLRSFVQEHPQYKSDSVVGKGVLYDLVKLVKEISETDSSLGFREKLLRKQDIGIGGAKLEREVERALSTVIPGRRIDELEPLLSPIY